MIVWISSAAFYQSHKQLGETFTTHASSLIFTHVGIKHRFLLKKKQNKNKNQNNKLNTI